MASSACGLERSDDRWRGAEHAFGNKVSMFVEADASNFGTRSVDFADAGDECSPAFTAAIKQTVEEVKVGFNIKY